jgi:hypothetical protein
MAARGPSSGQSGYLSSDGYLQSLQSALDATAVYVQGVDAARSEIAAWQAMVAFGRRNQPFAAMQLSR